MDRESLYLRLPVPLQNAVCSLEGWRIQRSRFGGNFKNLLRESELRAELPEESLLSFRDKRLREMLRFASANVPFYKEKWRQAHLKVEEIEGLDDLNNLPVTTKSEVQDYSSSLKPEGFRGEVIPVHTSGTTGGGLKFQVTQEAYQEQWATWWRYRRWHGLDHRTMCGYFGGRSVVPNAQSDPPFWRLNRPGRQILFSGYHLSPSNLSAYVEALQKFRPPWLHGYPSLLTLLASYLAESKVGLEYVPEWITTGSENLMSHQKDLIEGVFGTQVRQHYGMAEGVANASECPQGRLHVDEDYAAVEFLDNGLGSASIVGTNLTNKAFPLIRYEVGDEAVLTNDGCSCGRPGRIVARIDGRKEDNVVLSDGSVLGRLDHIFKDMTNIREAQIYQPRTGELIFRIVKGPGYSDTDQVTLLNEARKRIGARADIRIDYVEGLTRSSTGKLRFVISDVRGAGV